MGGHDVVVLGGINTDFLVRGERLPEPGETLQREVFQEALGGKGADQAVAVTRLGCRAALIARIGSDERGRRMVDQLLARAWMQILTAPGPNRRLTDVDVDRARMAIESAKVLLAQLEVPPPLVGRAFRLARAAGGGYRPRSGSGCSAF